MLLKIELLNKTSYTFNIELGLSCKCKIKYIEPSITVVSEDEGCVEFYDYSKNSDDIHRAWICPDYYYYDHHDF
jgi:hypothetical protein